MTIQLKSFAQAMLIEGIRVTHAQNALFKTLQEVFTAASGVSLAKTTADALFKVMKAGYNTYSTIEEAKKEVTVNDLQKGKIANDIRLQLARSQSSEFNKRLYHHEIFNHTHPQKSLQAENKTHAQNLENPQTKSAQSVQTAQSNENSMNGMSTMDYIKMIAANIEAEKASQPSAENQTRQGRSV